MHIIKRYQNRKLYDTNAKKYITLAEISVLIKKGEDIQVFDNESGEDITAITLSQIILEQEKKHSGLLPGSVLTSLIRSGGERISALQKTLVSQINLTKIVDDEIERRISFLVESNSCTAEEGAELIDKLIRAGEFERSEGIFNFQDTRMTERQIQEFINNQGIPTKDDIRQLSKQLEALSSKLESLKKTSS